MDPDAPAPPNFSLADIPDVCPVCGQVIDQNSSYAIAHHREQPKHLPYVGAGKNRKRRSRASTVPAGRPSKWD